MKPLRRAGMAIATAVAVTLGLAGCGTAAAPDGQSTELSQEPVTLRMYWWGGDGRHQITQQVIDLFEAKYPNITVEPEFTDWTGYWDKLATATAGGNTPDVIQMDQLYLASYAERGTLADLGALSQLDAAGLADSVLGMGRSGDTLYGMPISTTGFGVLVNLDLLEQLGIDLPDDSTWTWEEYGTWVKSIADASGGEIQGTGVGFIEFHLQLVARQLGDELFAADDIVIKPETLAQFFQYNLDWVNSGAAASGEIVAERVSLPIDQQDFSIGKAATSFIPSTMITAYTTALGGGDTALLELPTVEGVQAGWEYLKPGMYWSISSRSEHPAEAALLVDFFVNDAEAAKLLGVERGMPANPASLDAIAADLSVPEQKAVAFVDSLDLGEAPAIVPTGASEIQAVLQRYMVEVITERQTPIDAANAMIAEIRSSIQAAQ